MGNKTSLTSLPARWIAFAGTIRLILFFAILPWALSLIGHRHGWSAGIPSVRNLLGLAITGGGAFLLLWCTSLHITRYSSLAPIDAYPPFLLVEGPYRFSRNPMYVADVAIWLGWVLFYGSIAIFLATFCFAAFLAFVSVPAEERQLLARFGDEYQAYKSSVRRWLGRRQRTPGMPNNSLEPREDTRTFGRPGGLPGVAS